MGTTSRCTRCSCSVVRKRPNNGFCLPTLLARTLSTDAAFLCYVLLLCSFTETTAPRLRGSWLPQYYSIQSGNPVVARLNPVPQVPRGDDNSVLSLPAGKPG